MHGEHILAYKKTKSGLVTILYMKNSNEGVFGFEAHARDVLSMF